MRKLGPRVYVKRDEESSIGRGCILHGAHFRPEIAKIVWAACHAVTEVAPAFDELWLTEGYRDVRSSRDLHEELRGLDITFRSAEGLRPMEGAYQAIAKHMEALLGPDYDIVCHAVGSDASHGHAEYDP